MSISHLLLVGIFFPLFSRAYAEYLLIRRFLPLKESLDSGEVLIEELIGLYDLLQIEPLIEFLHVLLDLLSLLPILAGFHVEDVVEEEEDRVLIEEEDPHLLAEAELLHLFLLLLISEVVEHLGT